MIRINLLPPEEQTRAGRSVNFKMPAFGNFIPVGVALVAVIACLGTFLVQSRTMTQLETNLEEARAESERLARLREFFGDAEAGEGDRPGDQPGEVVTDAARCGT